MSKAKNATGFLAHLQELRQRLLYVLILWICIVCGLFYFANDLYRFIAMPLITHLPFGSQMIATDVTTPFFTPFKLTLVVAFFLIVPFILYQIWQFITPALYQHEKFKMRLFIYTSSTLFYLGMFFAYVVVCPLVLKFFTHQAPENVLIATDIASYLDFILKLFFAFGLAFEVPVFTALGVSIGLFTTTQLKKNRPYLIVVTFIVAMLLTPPDVLSQLLLAGPMWFLFECGLIVASWIEKKDTAAKDNAYD